MLNVSFLPYSASSIDLVKTVPSSHADISSCTPEIKIEDVYGETLLSQTSSGVSVYGGATLTSAASYGATSFEVADSDPTMTIGRVYRLDADGDAYDDITVLDYSVSGGTRTVTTKERLEYDHTSGASVEGRYITYTLDISDTDTWENLAECVISWCGDDLIDAGGILTDLVTVRKYYAVFSKVESEFKSLYPDIYALVGDGNFDGLLDVARRRLDTVFKLDGRTFDSVVERLDVRNALISEIARRILLNTGATSTERYETFAVEADNELKLLRESRIWIDDDDDRIREQEENATALLPPIRRFIR